MSTDGEFGSAVKIGETRAFASAIYKMQSTPPSNRRVRVVLGSRGSAQAIRLSAYVGSVREHSFLDALDFLAFETDRVFPAVDCYYFRL